MLPIMFNMLNAPVFSVVIRKANLAILTYVFLEKSENKKYVPTPCIIFINNSYKHGINLL